MKKIILFLLLPVICFGQALEFPSQSEWDTLYKPITDTVVTNINVLTDSNYYDTDINVRNWEDIWIGDIYGDKYVLDSNYDWIPIIDIEDSEYVMGNVNEYWDIKEVDTLYFEMGYFYTIRIIKRVRYYDCIWQVDSAKVSINDYDYYVHSTKMEPVYGIDTIVIIDHKKLIKFINILENIIDRVENKNMELEFKLKRLEDRFEAFLKATEWVY